MKTERHTIHTVAALIKSRWESDEPDQVLHALRAFDGKNITTRMIDKLPGGKERWYLRREYGMTHICTRDYGRSGGEIGYSFMVAHTEASVPFSSVDFESRNACYFSARRERNHKRMEAVNDRDMLQEMADTLNDLDSAQRALTMASERFDVLTGYDATFSPDRFALMKLWEPTK